MATKHQNLSKFDKEALPSAKGYRFAIIVSEWNKNITENLHKGAYQTLIELGAEKADIKTFYVPGAFELPLAAQYVLNSTTPLHAVICLASVIQGATKHFDFICQTVAQGIKDVSLKYNKPVIFGVLTDYTLQQAIDRSGGKHGNKGVESAIAAVKMANFTKKLDIQLKSYNT